MNLTERLAGKVALVTGGASGIGLATARRFAAEGAHVVVGDVDAAALATLAAADPEIVGQPCDVRLESDVEALAATAVDRFGGLDLAFANAGTGSFASLTDIDAADWMRVVEVNLLGPVLTIKHAARRMRDGGSIVITASLNAIQPAPGMSAYCCTKAAAAMLAEVAAMELGPRRIRVNAIGPGIVEDFDENAPLATDTSADDVASLVTFLASDESASITGTLQLIDRGAHTKRYPDVLAHLAALPASTAE